MILVEEGRDAAIDQANAAMADSLLLKARTLEFISALTRAGHHKLSGTIAAAYLNMERDTHASLKAIMIVSLTVGERDATDKEKRLLDFMDGIRMRSVLTGKEGASDKASGIKEILEFMRGE